jgi:putative transposase
VAQSLAKNLIHLIFSTKDRRPMIGDAIREELHTYAAGILNSLNSPALAINSVRDHMHMLFVLHKNHSLAHAVQEVKQGTSRWIKTQGAEYALFYWQNGYGAFSVSQSGVPEVIDYIGKQQEHHRKLSFQDEFRAFLKRYEVAFQEQYVWD